MAFEEKPKSTAQKVNKDLGEYREIFIEKHEKAADLTKMVNRYQKTVGAEVVDRTDEGVTIRYPIANAEKYQRESREKANRLARVPQAIRPDQDYAGISSVDKNTVENADIKDLMGGN
jgi:hypothetical protein